MKKLFILLAVIMLASLNLAYASIEYPVAELDNCKNQQACEAYCDVSNNIEACVNYAEKAGLMTSQEIAEARKIMPFLIGGTTPGSCKNQRECDAYCDNEANLNECIDFAVKAGMMDASEAEMAKKMGGKGPGGCKREECKTYCEDESHIQECVDFAVQNGMMDASEAEIVKKTGGKGPGNCKGKEECDNFCKQPENMQTCIDFAVQYGMMTEEEAEMVKKSGGTSPGNCKSKEECDAFCSSEQGREVCLEWSKEHGMISDEEYQKTKQGNQGGGWSGPGGCKTESECKAYCEAEGHMQECMDASLKSGFMTQEQYNEQMANWVKSQEEMRQAEQQRQEGMMPKDTQTPGDYQETQPGNYQPSQEIPQTEQAGQMPAGEQVPQGEMMQPGGGSGGSSSGDMTGGSPGGTTSGEGGVGSGGSYEPSSGGEAAPAPEVAPTTGSVIRENPMRNFLRDLIDFFRNLF